jgi:hypothetical protein
VALAALSFLAIGIANAQTANNNTTITVQIINNSQGQAVFSPNAITVKSGTQVNIVNHTRPRQLVFSNEPIVFLNLASGASASIIPQVSPERLKIYDSLPSSLLITISLGP